MQPTTSTTNIPSTPPKVTQAEIGSSATIAKVKSSSEKLESIELLSTYTTLYSVDETQAGKLTPCSSAHTANEAHETQFDRSRCTITLNDHQHIIKKIEKVSCAKNPIPHKAFAKSETLRYLDKINQNWLALEHISTVLYPSNAQLPNFRSTLSNQIPITETIKNKETHCIHKIKTQLLVPLAENPIPDGAFAINQLTTYASPNIFTQTSPTALSTGSVTLTPSGSAVQFFLVVPSTAAGQQAPTNIKTTKKVRLPRHWKGVNEETQAFYLDDIEQCLDLGATYSMIVNRHQLPRGNIHALVQLRRKLRLAEDESKLGQKYKKGSKNVLTMPELPKDQIPLGQYLATEVNIRRSQLISKKLKAKVKQQQVKTAKTIRHFRPRLILPATQSRETSVATTN